MLPKASLLESFPLPTTDISAIPAPTFTQGGNTNLARASFSQVLSLIWFLIDIRVIIISRGRLVSFMCFTVIGESVTGLSCVCFTLNEMPAVTTDYFSTWKVSKISESVTQFDESHKEKHKKLPLCHWHCRLTFFRVVTIAEQSHSICAIFLLLRLCEKTD